MFDFFDNTPQLLPVKVKKEEAKLVPMISNPATLAIKRQELQDLVKKATEDGEITSMEYNELLELTIQVGVNNSELNEMIREEYKKSLIDKVHLFAEDGVIDENEMKLLLSRAKEIGMSKDELNTCINEALSKYDIEMKKKFRNVCITVAGIATVAATAVLATAIRGNMNISLSSITKRTTQSNDTTVRHVSEKN